MRLMWSSVAVVACLGGAAQKAPPPGAWLGVFRPLPGARELCNQHILGGDTAAKRIEIAFTLYGSAKPTPDVVRFYAEAHKLPFEPGTNALVVKLAAGRKVLRVFRAKDDYPTCGVDPRPDEPTVILVSELTSMAQSVPDRAGATDGIAELRALTEARFAANARGDRAFYERLLAANATVLLPKHAPLAKQAYLDEEFASRPAGLVNPKASISNFKAIVDGDTAVATYDVSEPTPLGEQTFDVRTSRLDTYVRLAGTWRLLSMAVVEAPSWPDVAPIASTLLDEYAGTYRVSGDIIVVITNESGRLMQAMTGQPKGELFAENATTFFDRADSPLARTVFERDASGKVVAQVYRAMGQTIRAVKVR